MEMAEGVQNKSNTKISFSIDIEIDNDWIEYITKETDIFMTSYIGYWAYGMEHDEELGWLLYENEAELPLSKVAKLRAFKDIVADWRAGKALPEGWFRLDRAAATRAYVEGVKSYGADWYQSGASDATTYDVVLQLALLGEVRYG